MEDYDFPFYKNGNTRRGGDWMGAESFMHKEAKHSFGSERVTH